MRLIIAAVPCLSPYGLCGRYSNDERNSRAVSPVVTVYVPPSLAHTVAGNSVNVRCYRKQPRHQVPGACIRSRCPWIHGGKSVLLVADYECVICRATLDPSEGW